MRMLQMPKATPRKKREGENNLEVKEEIVPISARLIANKSSFRFNSEKIEKILSEMKKQMEEEK